MPRQAEKLTTEAALQKAVRRAFDQEAAGQAVLPRTVLDGAGLHLLLMVKGRVSPAWRFTYSHGGARKMLSLGKYPTVSLKQARIDAGDFREKVASGTNPSDGRKARRAALTSTGGDDSFEAVARRFADVKGSGKWSPDYKRRWLRTLEIDIFSKFGKVPIAEVTRKGHLMPALYAIQERDAIETAHLAAQWCGAVFKWAMVAELCEANPASGVHVLLQTPKSKHMGAATTPEEARTLLQAIQGYRGHVVTRAGLRFGVLTFQRPGNVRAAKWKDIDLDAAMWSIPSSEMKRSVKEKREGKPHLVPLSRQAVDVLRELHPFTAHRSAFVFPSLHSVDKPMSENTQNVAFRRMGFTPEQATAHGARAMARTLAAEVLKVNPEVIEEQLAHGKADALGNAYNRTKWLSERVDLMQRWADYCDRLVTDNVRELKRA